MKIGLWIVQVLLAIGSFMPGMMKLVTPREELLTKMAWVEDFPHWFIQMIAVFEVLGD